jgi:general nucleoside transport system permease protein
VRGCRRQRGAVRGARPSLPRWVDIGLIPLANVFFALLAAGLIVLAIGENPLAAVRVMLAGAVGDSEGIGYTLYYATNFIFTGLAVAVAFHAGLFNIGGEGQAALGGLGVGLVLLAGDRHLPFAALLPLALLAGMGFGAAWAFVPAWLQAYRGSHIVITTIMFNFLAAALMVYLMVNVLIAPRSMSPESREFGAATHLPQMHEVLAPLGVKVTATPLNLSIVLAAVLCVFVWLLLWHTAFGFELRTAGHSETAAVYAGVRPRRVIMISMCLSGAIAGCVGVNEIMGVHHRLLLNFTAGYGFTGIAVALMGRNHPVGIVLAGLLFGILSQGGTELAFAMPTITRDMIVVIQGLVILFSGALPQLSRPAFEWLFAILSRRAPELRNA